MVYVSVSETYDLSTVPNKMTLIGVHTPDAKLISKMYPGLCVNAKYCRIVSQDVAIACASMEAADPLQVGTAPGTIAPEDLFNPILYKAVSNASMSQLEGRLHAINALSTTETPAIEGHQAVVDNDEVTTITDEFPVYYSLLSNRDGFRAANPQQGLSMTGLKPLVFEKLYNVGTWSDTKSSPGDSYHGISNSVINEELVVSSLTTRSMLGNPKPMPRFPTSFITGTYPGVNVTAGQDYQANGMGDGSPNNYQCSMPYLMPVFTAAIIVPPSRLHKLYYRMVIRTHLEFTEVRPITDVASFGDLANFASEVYYNDYEDVSKRFADVRLDQVDVSSADVKKVMEGN